MSPIKCPSASFDYDADGNLTSDGTLTYEWDGENRLAAAYKTSPSTGDKKVTFAYDYRADWGHPLGRGCQGAWRSVG